MLVENNEKIDKFTKILFYYGIGFVFLAMFFIWQGAKYSLLSIAQFGIFQIFTAILISFVVRYRNYELLIKKKANDIIETNLGKKNEEILQADHLEQNDIEAEQVAGNNSIAKEKAPDKELDPVMEFKKFCDLGFPLGLLFIALLAIFIEVLIFICLKSVNYIEKPPILIGIFSIFLSFLLLVSSNLFRQNEDIRVEYKMLTHFINASQWMSFTCGLTIIIRYFGFGQAEHYISYIISVFLIVVFLEAVFQSIRHLIDGRNRHSIELKFYILPALISGGNPVSQLLASMEGRTGISFRSTWTIRFIRRNLLIITLIVGGFLWLMTSFVQINPNQKGLLFSLGKLEREQPLLPGIHLKLPWPVQTVKVYPAYKINSFTVGYETDKRSDYLWTADHNGEEYKLLLGGGKELVSINMQVFFKIGDLYEYTLQYDNPEEKLKAEAYRILLNETVITDLDKLLSLNRSSFSKMVEQKLQETSKSQKLGIEVTSVALTSIHPPTEIARQYQEIVSADVQKQTIITNAKSYAGSAIPKAQKAKEEVVKLSQVESVMRKGQAGSEALKYSYVYKAYGINNSAYKEWKWLEILEKTLSGKKMYLLDKNLNLQKGNLWLDMRAKDNTVQGDSRVNEEYGLSGLQEGEGVGTNEAGEK
ncbi:modulator of FtsH protease HflK [Ruminiclostridium hungatei]|uniref:Modulator of FtsH protease HflK n=1 Tax=Ruminiclostridium hungatei TaxID=48256 RepID=A0A1V4SKF4_RUMHU|nr:SPFH domain-containing protein [Ruminiclostridium hungatei]OPX44294.1 modulator of FtsH protease HflK [Ruminiclostridium hungatei]